MPARPRVALATCAAVPELHDDDVPLLAALDRLGVDARPAVWDDPAERWTDDELVVVRSTWDYVPRRDELLAWAAGIPRLANPARVLAWNTDKHYLRDLADAGVPVVPTSWVEPGDVGWAPPPFEHVVKPAVSAGAVDTARYAAGKDSSPHVRRLQDAGRSVMVQPYLRGVDTWGETSVVHLGGRFSHAARKAPVLVPGLDDPNEVGISPREPSAQELAVAAAALAAAPGPLLYARVDLVPGPDGAPVVIELELTEPSLFLSVGEGAVERFAAAIRDAAAAGVRPARR